MEITYLGQSGFLIKIEDIQLVFDPFISGNPLADSIDISSLNPNYVLLTHGHQDHVADAETILKQSGAKLISNFEIVNWFGAKGIENGHPMNHGGQWEFNFGKVKMVNAIHSSSMPDGSYGGNPAGFVISTKEATFYHAGDTALHQDMKQIGDEFDLDFAFLPIGDNFTMGIDDAIKSAELIGTNNIIAMHFDTFPYIEINHQEVKAKASSSGIELLIPEIGRPFNK